MCLLSTVRLRTYEVLRRPSPIRKTINVEVTDIRACPEGSLSNIETLHEEPENYLVYHMYNGVNWCLLDVVDAEQGLCFSP